MPNYDLTPLSSNVTHSDINRYRKDGYKLSEKIAPAYHYVPVVGFVFGVMGYLPARASEDFTDNSFFEVLIVLIFIIIGLFEGWHWCVTLPKRAWIRMVRLARFAEANDLSYTPELLGPKGRGVLFSQPNIFEVFDDLVVTNGGHSFEFGNAAVVKAKMIRPLKAYNWGFLHIKLTYAMPHIILESKSNNHLVLDTSMPSDFRKNNIKELDKELGQCFDMFAAQKYTHKDLAVLTPKFMKLLTEELRDYDVEVVDKSLYIYKNNWFDLDDPEVMQGILGMITNVSAALKVLRK